MDEPRYAIYFVPPAESALYRFGAGFLGYDCYTGESLPHPQDVALAAPEWDALTREARKYGFHATLKAPFRLLPPFGEADLTAELERFAAIPRTLPEIKPIVQSLAGFIAVVADTPSLDLDRLAADAVMAFERFRRPPSSHEREQRLGAGLSERQTDNLDSLRLRRLSLSHDLDGPDRRRSSERDPRAAAGALRRDRGRACAAGRSGRLAAPGAARE